MFIFQNSTGMLSSKKTDPPSKQKNTPLDLSTIPALNENIWKTLTLSSAKGETLFTPISNQACNTFVSGLNSFKIKHDGEEISLAGAFGGEITPAETPRYLQFYNDANSDKNRNTMLASLHRDRYGDDFSQSVRFDSNESLKNGLATIGFKEILDSDIPYLLGPTAGGRIFEKDGQTYLIRRSLMDENKVNVWLVTGVTCTDAQSKEYVNCRNSLQAYAITKAISFLEEKFQRKFDNANDKAIFNGAILTVSLGLEIFTFALEESTKMAVALTFKTTAQEKKGQDPFGTLTANLASFSNLCLNTPKLFATVDAIYGTGYADNFMKNILPKLYNSYLTLPYVGVSIPAENAFIAMDSTTSTINDLQTRETIHSTQETAEFTAYMTRKKKEEKEAQEDKEKKENDGNSGTGFA